MLRLRNLGPESGARIGQSFDAQGYSGQYNVLKRTPFRAHRVQDLPEMHLHSSAERYVS